MVAPFALATVSTARGTAEDSEVPALVVDIDGSPRWHDLSGTAPSVHALLRDWDAVLPRLRDLAAEAKTPLDTEDLRAPLAPGQILQAGANYRTHVIDLAVKHSPDRPEDEVRAEVGALMDRRITGGEPYIFIGLTSSVTGPYDDVVLPAYSQQHDWELELAVVIGREAFQVDSADALAHVAGYTIANDLTTRDLVFRRDMPEIGSDWFRAKNAPGFTPLGPYLVPAEFVPEHPRVRLDLNGEVMQDESTKDMIFDVAALVAAASRTAVLRPGDLLLTGSPAGNGMAHGRFLRAGDVMTGSVTGLGTQRTRVVAPKTGEDA
ncbi:2-keto-4-pentenoate hydratase/2-oxohepta-3-ene-1,7-dioic acid hydratase (catechol pathway) [Lentzea fradiae]|uniref:2-keto-4-pentenoate hydratase/2-oxohepta-3-ene-1,7-dioic acid hydratase (Catechol pathway) n=1 Tax=Lentzea fradiae TaxID=200378 RepID=A0A1G7KYZ0_9PSEU|nr:fumarylacetoacetate hydrolase family protein [Lentzea fradiae]SDF41949.1 2-keto-4-pentenoate hydratase/2-oxohepta-3-ene-1,7-dioic acid hydratase (catechol pathway) [Lentzea fradiae]